MGYIVYGANGSGSSIVEAALAEIGVDYRVEAVDLKNEGQRDAVYAAVNPHRKVPTLVTPAGETLTESVAIVLTLAERHSEAGLLPPEASPERAVALRWMMFAATELYPVIEIIDYPRRFSPSDEAEAGVRDVALEIWRQRWLTVEGGLGEGPYLLGDTFSMADVYLTVLSGWDLKPDWRAEHLPKVERVAKAVFTRPKLRDLWPRHFPKRI